MSHSCSVPSTIPVSIASPQTRPTSSTDGGSLLDSKQKHPDALPVRKASGTGLFGGFVGLSPLIVIITTDYRLFPDTEIKTLDAAKDTERLNGLIQTIPFVSREVLHTACHRRFTKARAVKMLDSVRPSPLPKLVYLGGHANLSLDGESFEYIPDDYTKSDPSRIISSTQLREMLVDSNGSHPTKMILITDFCYSFNFLRLPWTLWKRGGEYFWEKSEESTSGTWNEENKILHFAAGSKGASTYTFDSAGSLFLREFCNAEHVGGVGKSLSNRMSTIQRGILEYCHAHHSDAPGVRVHQHPQLYASHPFDLDEPATLAELLRSL
ncbi:hypothetical protein RhiJN_27161 [Ceratobasidium sp. AG-Ba]|nr:hypothetical protein RhiJN_27161 [Ceratobasidium sp. AG-Ba]